MSVNFSSLKGTILWLKSEIKGQILYIPFDLGLFNAYKLMYCDRNINEKKGWKMFDGNK